MARKFSIPAIPALAVGESCYVVGTPASVNRKVGPYSVRHGKSFTVEQDPTYLGGTRVTRLPDPEPQP